MIHLEIPGFGELRIERVLLDYNGTLALDGALLPGVREDIAALAAHVEVSVLTADTFGTVRDALGGVCPVSVLTAPGLSPDTPDTPDTSNAPAQSPRREAEAKLDVLRRSGATSTVFVGNGANDALALAQAALGIAVLGPEGAAAAALCAAHVVCPSIGAALGLLLHPQRLRATLRR